MAPQTKAEHNTDFSVSDSFGKGRRRRKKVISMIMFCTLKNKILPLEISTLSEFNASEEVACKKIHGWNNWQHAGGTDYNKYSASYCADLPRVASVKLVQNHQGGPLAKSHTMKLKGQISSLVWWQWLGLESCKPQHFPCHNNIT